MIKEKTNSRKDEFQVSDKIWIRIIRQGEPFGRNDSLIYKSETPAIEFFIPKSIRKEEHGIDTDYMINRYDAESIYLHEGYLALVADDPDYNLSASQMKRVSEYLSITI